MNDGLLRIRIKHMREQANLSQEDVAKAMGLNDRQAYSNIELGSRAISAEEAVAVARALGVSVLTLTDPLQLAGEGRFSWRQRGAAGQDLLAFEAKAGRWIAAFRHFNKLRDEPVNARLIEVGIHEGSTHDEAAIAGEQTARMLGLGDVPAAGLAQVVESSLNTLVLYVDAIEGVSGAACQVGVLNTILVNRNEPAQRRNYDLAHELFHILTWAALPPRHIDEATGPDRKYRRIEQLAENFAAGLLMPSATIHKIIERDPLPAESDMGAWINRSAPFFQVSNQALSWRLVNLKLLPLAMRNRLDEAGKLAPRGTAQSAGGPPPRFSKRFLETVAWAIDSGSISARRACDLMDVPLEKAEHLFQQHGLACPFEL